MQLHWVEVTRARMAVPLRSPVATESIKPSQLNRCNQFHAVDLGTPHRFAKSAWLSLMPSSSPYSSIRTSSSGWERYRASGLGRPWRYRRRRDLEA